MSLPVLQDDVPTKDQILAKLNGRRVVASVSGGKEYEPFYDPSLDGCMRWGLCDYGTDEGGEESKSSESEET